MQDLGICYKNSGVFEKGMSVITGRDELQLLSDRTFVLVFGEGG